MLNRNWKVPNTKFDTSEHYHAGWVDRKGDQIHGGISACELGPHKHTSIARTGLVSSHVALSQDINHVIQFLAGSRFYLQSCGKSICTCLRRKDGRIGISRFKQAQSIKNPHLCVKKHSSINSSFCVYWTATYIVLKLKWNSATTMVT